jgi:hypothetical protein
VEGCLSNLIKLIILGGLFCVGLVAGYFYYQGAFDAYLVAYAFDKMPRVPVEQATKAVDAAVTPEAAYKDLGAVDARYVLWRGQVSETRSLAHDLTAVTLLTNEAPRRVAMVFVTKPLQSIGVRLGDDVEVLGWLKKTLVMSEDREGRRYPQILALSVTKVQARGAPEADPGETTAHGAEPAPDGSPAPSPAPSPARSPGGAPR